jgi:hypothetical protein
VTRANVRLAGRGVVPSLKARTVVGGGSGTVIRQSLVPGIVRFAAVMVLPCTGERSNTKYERVSFGRAAECPTK